jgi:thioredoxin 1
MEIISESLFKEKIRKENSGKIVVQMSTTWCGPCKKMKVMMESLSSTYNDIKLMYMDIGECNEEFNKIFNIKSVPTTVFFDNGRILYTHTGVPGTKAALNDLIVNTYNTQGE